MWKWIDHLINLSPRVSAEADPTDQDTLQYELKIKCSRNSSVGKESTRAEDLYLNNNGSKQ